MNWPAEQAQASPGASAQRYPRPGSVRMSCGASTRLVAELAPQSDTTVARSRVR